MIIPIYHQGMGMMQQKMPGQLGGGPGGGKADNKPGLPTSRPSSANTGPGTPQVSCRVSHKCMFQTGFDQNRIILFFKISIHLLALNIHTLTYLARRWHCHADYNSTNIHLSSWSQVESCVNSLRYRACLPLAHAPVDAGA